MKIIEAMSVGAPIIFSQKSADGLPQFPERICHQSSDSFKLELIELLSNPIALEERTKFSSAYFEQHFESRQVQKQLLHMLEELQNNR